MQKAVIGYGDGFNAQVVAKDIKELKESQNLILESLANGICNLDTNCRLQ